MLIQPSWHAISPSWSTASPCRPRAARPERSCAMRRSSLSAAFRSRLVKRA